MRAHAKRRFCVLAGIDDDDEPLCLSDSEAPSSDNGYVIDVHGKRLDIRESYFCDTYITKDTDGNDIFDIERLKERVAYFKDADGNDILDVAFNREDFYSLVMCELPNQQEAFDLCPRFKHRDRRVRDFSRLIMTWQFIEAFYDNFLRLCGNPVFDRMSRMRAAFEKLEFRCLRKAYAPGLAGQKRSRKVFEKEFVADDDAQ